MVEELVLDSKYYQLYETGETIRKKKKRGRKARNVNIAFVNELIKIYEINQQRKIDTKLKECIKYKNEQLALLARNNNDNIYFINTLRIPRKQSIAKKMKKPKKNMSISRNDIYIIYNALDDNTFECKCCKSFNNNGKLEKYYENHSIKYISRLLWTASQLNGDLLKLFCSIPDVAFIIKRIEEDSFSTFENYIINY